MPGMVKSMLFGLSLIALASCAHQEGAKKTEEPQRETEPPEGAVAKPGPQTRAIEPLPRERIDDFMTEHFIIATWSRDAVINGRLDLLREPMAALAAYDYATVAPGGWMRFVAKMQHAADLTARAANLDGAATGVATMARTCGECHAATGRGPAFASDHRDGRAPSADTFGARMQRHMWAADRLWEGLTGPSDSAWEAGASALARAPFTAPSTDPPLPADYVRALDEVRELGDRAVASTTLAERADVYGLFLASCAGCHAYQVEHEF
jgi:mono/diheme cytochrome c family protein